jgi:hypothetical protein
MLDACFGCEGDCRHRNNITARVTMQEVYCEVGLVRGLVTIRIPRIIGRGDAISASPEYDYHRSVAAQGSCCMQMEWMDEECR